MRVALLVLMLWSANSYACEVKEVKWYVLPKCKVIALVKLTCTDKAYIIEAPISVCANGTNHAGLTK